MKQCTECKVLLPESEFSLKTGRPGQKHVLRSKCKQCIRKIHRQKYNRNRTKSTNKRKAVVIGPDTTKECAECHKAKLLSEFHRECKSPTKLWHWSSYCKSCSAKRQRKYRGYKRPSLNTAEGILLDRKQKHVSKGFYCTPFRKIPFDLSLQDIKQVIQRQSINGFLYCDVSRLPLDIEKYGPLRASIDRIDSTKGYYPDNIRIVCLLYNLMKNKWTDDQIKHAIKGYYPNLDFSKAITSYFSRIKPHVVDNIYVNPRNKSKYSFNITEDDIYRLVGLQTENGRLKCALTGIDISNKPKSPSYISVDRIDPHVGYEPANIRLTTVMANLGRNKWPDSDFISCWRHIKNQFTAISSQVKFIWPDDNQFKCSHSPKQISDLSQSTQKEVLVEFNNLLSASKWVAPTYNQSELLHDWQRIRDSDSTLYHKKDGFKLNVGWRGGFPGKKIILNYQPHFWEVHIRGSSLESKWNNNQLPDRAATKLITTGSEISLERYLRELKHAGVGIASHFHPNFAIAVITKLCSTASSWFDPFMGWGGRLLASAALNIDYEGCEQEYKTFMGLQNIKKFINSNAILHGYSISNYKFNNKYDLIFTSPPFYTKECYGHKIKGKFEQWYTEFLLPTAIKLYNHCHTMIFHLDRRLYERFKCDFNLDVYPVKQFSHGSHKSEYICVFTDSLL